MKHLIVFILAFTSFVYGGSRERDMPSKIVLLEDISLDTEKLPAESIAYIGCFDVDQKGNLYIYDSKLKKIVVYDPEGKFSREFGREGQGPGEFRFVTNIQVMTSGEIVITDILNRRFASFQKDGAFIKDIRFPFSAVEGSILENGHFLFKRLKLSGSKDKRPHIVLSLYDPDFKKIKDLDEIEAFDPMASRVKGIYYNLCWDVSGDKIVTGSQERGYEIYVFDLQGTLLKKIRKQYRPVAPSTEYRQAFIDSLPKRNYEMIKNRLYFPKQLPPFHDLFIDESGKIFVMTYEKKGPRTYVMDVFSPGGQCILSCGLNIPILSRGFRGQIKNNRFYFVYEKNSGFQELKVYKIQWK